MYLCHIYVIPLVNRDLGDSFSKHFELFFDILIGRVCHENRGDINDMAENNQINNNNNNDNKNTTSELDFGIMTTTTSVNIMKPIEKKKRNLNSDQITKLFECLSFLIK